MFGKCCIVDLLFFFFLSFYLFERERENEWREGRERGGNRIQRGLCADDRQPDAGLKLMNH